MLMRDLIFWLSSLPDILDEVRPMRMSFRVLALGLLVASSAYAQTPRVVSLTISPDTIAGGSTQVATGTVTLSSAPTVNTGVHFTIDPSDVVVIFEGGIVLAGQTTATFRMKSISTVAQPRTATITAELGGGEASATETVVPLVITVSANPTTLVAGTPPPPQTAALTVSLSAPIIPNAVILITSDSAAVGAPGQVRLANGESQTYTIAAGPFPVPARVLATLTVKFGANEGTTTIAVLPLSCLSDPSASGCEPPEPPPPCPDGAASATAAGNGSCPPPPAPKQFAVFLDTLPTGGVTAVRERRLIPATGGQLSPFLVKLGELLKLEVFEVNPDTLEPVGRIDVVPTLGEQIVVERPLLSEFFSQPSRLFPNNVLIRFTGESERDHFLPVHSGTGFVVFPASFLEPPGGAAPQPVSVPIGIDTCAETGPCGFSLGVSFNEFDADVIRMADLRGVPPQILKAQIQQETDPDFDPNSYRYEPLTVDFLEVQGLLLDPRFEPYRLESHIDCRFLPTVILRFPQGSGIPPTNDTPDVTPREKYQIQTDTTDQPLCETLDQPRSLFVRPLAPRDRHVSMENILITDRARDGRRQNWMRDPKTGRESPAFGKYRVSRRRNPPFTAQPVLASSYGLMQVLYTSVVIDLDTTVDGTRLSPRRFLEVQTSLDLGTEHLLQNKCQPRSECSVLFSAPTLLSFDQLKNKIGVALSLYQGAPPVEGDFSESNLNEYAKPILLLSNRYYPVR